MISLYYEFIFKKISHTYHSHIKKQLTSFNNAKNSDIKTYVKFGVKINVVMNMG